MSIRKNLIVILVMILVCVYVALVTGIFDLIFIQPYRLVAVDRVKQASSKVPPDWVYLLGHLQHPDWFVVTVTLARIAEAQKSESVPPEMIHSILKVIFTNVGEHGHWWRFGWDKDEPEFEQFRSQLIKTASLFGIDALPFLEKAAKHRSAVRRETVCWIISEMIRDSSDMQQVNMTSRVYKIVDDLAQNDPEPTVRSVCSAITHHQ